MSTVPLPSCACLTVKSVVALLVEDAVVVVLLQGKPFAIWVGVAFLNASLKSRDVEGINDIALALEAAVTLSGRTPVLYVLAVKPFKSSYILIRLAIFAH